MLQWNELKIDLEGKYLVIEVSVEDSPYYENVYLDSVQVVPSKNYKEGGGTPIFSFDCGGLKSFRKVVDIDGISKDIFFVYALSTGEPDASAPCGINDSSIVGVVYNKQPIYEQGIKMLRSIGGCEPSKELIDYILTDKALQLNIDTGNFPQAIENWKTLMDVTSISSAGKSRCGCHG